jgi:hypothetical protein
MGGPPKLCAYHKAQSRLTLPQLTCCRAACLAWGQRARWALSWPAGTRLQHTQQQPRGKGEVSELGRQDCAVALSPTPCCLRVRRESDNHLLLLHLQVDVAWCRPYSAQQYSLEWVVGAGHQLLAGVGAVVQVVATQPSTTLGWPATVPLFVNQPDLAAVLWGLWHRRLLTGLFRAHQQQPDPAEPNSVIAQCYCM